MLALTAPGNSGAAVGHGEVFVRDRLDTGIVEYQN